MNLSNNQHLSQFLGMMGEMFGDLKVSSVEDSLVIDLSLRLDVISSAQLMKLTFAAAGLRGLQLTVVYKNGTRSSDIVSGNSIY